MQKLLPPTSSSRLKGTLFVGVCQDFFFVLSRDIFLPIPKEARFLP
jgi:hypothetical protein